MDDAAWGQQRCEGERKCAGPATQIAPCLRTRFCNLVYPNQFGCVSNVHRNLALRAWFLPASRYCHPSLRNNTSRPALFQASRNSKTDGSPRNRQQFHRQWANARTLAIIVSNSRLKLLTWQELAA